MKFVKYVPMKVFISITCTFDTIFNSKMPLGVQRSKSGKRFRLLGASCFIIWFTGMFENKLGRKDEIKIKM